MDKKIQCKMHVDNNFELGDIIYSPVCTKVSNLVVTYADENIVGASTIIKTKKTCSQQSNSVLLADNDNYNVYLKTFIITRDDLKKHNWVIINKQIREVIIEPHPVKNENVKFDYLNSNLKIKFSVHQSIVEKNLHHKLTGEVKHKNYKLFSYVNLKNK